MFAEAFDTCGPDVRNATEPPARHALSLLFEELERARWMVRKPEQVLSRLLPLADLLDGTQRTAWLAGLRQTWRGQGWAFSGGLMLDLMRLTAAWDDWPLLHAVGTHYERSRELPGWADALLVEATLRLGSAGEALSRCRARMLRHPYESWAATAHDAVLRWMAFCDTAARPIRGTRLRLEPLGHHHWHDFAAQYGDPAIAELCCLPVFQSEDHWHRWLDACWGYGDQRLYAVIDPDWGFVGSVSLILHDTIGFFYYWIGRDYQGRGIGTAAVRLLLDAAATRHGMRTCYAKVFEHNARSRRALEKLGFAALDFRPAPPDANELFYRLGAAQTRERSVEEMRGLFERMKSDIRIAVPLTIFDAGRRRA